jgi:C1A family cysteine protease
MSGWIPDGTDASDPIFVPRRGPGRSSAGNKASVDLRPLCSPVENQGKMPTCTACALVGVLEFFDMKRAQQSTNLSRLFVYYTARTVDLPRKSLGKLEPLNNGVRIRDGLRALRRWGVCPEVLWPYEASQVNAKPEDDRFVQARERKIAKYYRIRQNDDGLAAMRQSLADGFPFVFGFKQFESFKPDGEGLVPMPDAKNEELVQRHACMAVGYDDGRQAFLVRNSLGADWGLNGHFWMPYDYLTKPTLARDVWTIRS